MYTSAFIIFFLNFVKHFIVKKFSRPKLLNFAETISNFFRAIIFKGKVRHRIEKAKVRIWVT